MCRLSQESARLPEQSVDEYCAMISTALDEASPFCGMVDLSDLNGLSTDQKKQIYDALPRDLALSWKKMRTLDAMRGGRLGVVEVGEEKQVEGEDVESLRDRSSQSS